VTYLKVHSRNLPRETEGRHEKPVRVACVVDIIARYFTNEYLECVPLAYPSH
jgi:hypothetical protein